MKVSLGWGSRQILVVVSLGIAVILISALLQLVSVTRLATDGARTECQIVAQSLALEIMSAVRDRGGDPISVLKSDRAITPVLQAATSHAPSVAFVAVYDSVGVTLVHTTPEQLGSAMLPLPPLPRPTSIGESMRLLRSLRQPSRGYAVDTPLRVGDRPFALIRVGVLDTFLRERVREAFRRTLFAAGLQLALALAVGVVLSNVATGRLRQIAAGIEALREGRFENRIPESGVDEFSRLARDLNLLSEQFERERERRRGGESQIRPALDLLGEGILTIGADGRVVLVNEPAAQIIGVPASAFRGVTLREALPASHPLLDLVTKLATSESRTMSVPVAGGEHVAIGHRIDGEGRSGSLLVEFKRARAQEELTSLVDQSRILTRLGQMAAGVAHEIRNPLQAIKFQLDALRHPQNLTTEETAGHVESARRDVMRMERSIEGFLTVARMRKPVVSRFQVRELLEEVRDASATDAIFAGLELEMVVEDGSLVLEADRQVLKQALQNLVKNATQALPSSSGKILFGCRQAVGAAVLFVHDFGPGIPAKHLDQVRNLYFSTKEGGTGVGLALVQQAADLHGGDVDIASEEGVGTTVTIRLPLVGADA